MASKAAMAEFAKKRDEDELPMGDEDEEEQDGGEKGKAKKDAPPPPPPARDDEGDEPPQGAGEGDNDAILAGLLNSGDALDAAAYELGDLILSPDAPFDEFEEAILDNLDEFTDETLAAIDDAGKLSWEECEALGEQFGEAQGSENGAYVGAFVFWAALAIKDEEEESEEEKAPPADEAPDAPDSPAAAFAAGGGGEDDAGMISG